MSSERLSRLTVAACGAEDVDLEYRYSGTQNDGLTTQMKDWVSGEEVTYQYDELKRLVSAVTTGPEWGLNFSYDGFGNRTGQSVVKGSGPVSSQSYDNTTNRLTGGSFGYDAAGNLTAMPGPGPGCAMTLTYDALNRVSTVNAGSCGYERYAYGPENRRMWKWRLSDEKEVVYLYGLGGERLGVYEVTENATTLGLSAEERALYFGGRRVWTDRTSGLGGEEEEFADRLGSVVWREGTRLSYYPYGEEKGTTTEQGRDKFGTYLRDEVTGLDYAVNRYYGSGLGRFLSADPYVAPDAVKDPRGWNRYGYVAGDPVNYLDPRGLEKCSGEECNPITDLLTLRVPGRYLSALNAEAKDRDDFQRALRRLKKHRNLNKVLRAQAAEALRNLSSGCQEALTAAGVDLNLIAATVASTEYYSALDEGNLTVQSVSGYRDWWHPNQTLGNYVGADRAAVLLDTDGQITNKLVLGRGYFYDFTGYNSLAEAQNITLVHEGLHTGLNMADSQLAAYLGLGRDLTAEAASASITNYLKFGCVPVEAK